MRSVIVNDINYLCLKLEAENQMSVKEMIMKVKQRLDRGSIRSSLRDGLSTPYRSAFSSSCTEFVCPECWHFDNDATSKIDDVLTDHG